MGIACENCVPHRKLVVLFKNKTNENQIFVGLVYMPIKHSGLYQKSIIIATM